MHLDFSPLSPCLRGATLPNDASLAGKSCLTRDPLNRNHWFNCQRVCHTEVWSVTIRTSFFFNGLWIFKSQAVYDKPDDWQQWWSRGCIKLQKYLNFYIYLWLFHSQRLPKKGPPTGVILIYCYRVLNGTIRIHKNLWKGLYFF